MEQAGTLAIETPAIASRGARRSALMQIVEVYKEIQAQQMNILKAFYVDLLVPLETNLEKDTKVVQIFKKERERERESVCVSCSSGRAVLKPNPQTPPSPPHHRFPKCRLRRGWDMKDRRRGNLLPPTPSPSPYLALGGFHPPAAICMIVPTTPPGNRIKTTNILRGDTHSRDQDEFQWRIVREGLHGTIKANCAPTMIRACSDHAQTVSSWIVSKVFSKVTVQHGRRTVLVSVNRDWAPAHPVVDHVSFILVRLFRANANLQEGSYLRPDNV
uniref:IMD domain-containing protein n=1 Tax=Timema monikensis TaxID=170555 RepID=A0A7R9HNW0_9NEOP|nr:unnamed protein product [Timema monikensis]